MDDKLVTIDTILNWLKDQVEKKIILSAHIWLDSAQKLNTLIGDEHDKLFTLQQKIALFKVQSMRDDPTVSMVKIRTTTEASNEYKEMQMQKARIGQIEEMIRIAKLQARMKDNELRNYN